MRKGQKRDFARQLRSRMTDAELRLWRELKRKQIGGMRFRRQCPIGPYIVDFVCLSAGVVIEIDGGQHAESVSDAVRDTELSSRGFRILRFWNNEVLENIEGVCDMIVRYADALHPHPDLPPHAGEGEKQ